MTSSGMPAPDRTGRLRPAGRPVLLAVLLAGIAGMLAGAGSWSAFSATTASQGNAFASGSVAIGDDDDDAGPLNLLSMTNGKPGSTVSGCVTVRYTGSLPGAVRIRATSSGTGLASYVDVVITRGTSTGAFPSCAGFTADATEHLGAGQGAGVIFKGRLSAFPSTWSSGVDDPTAATSETWTAGETHAYKVTWTIADDNNAQGKTASAEITWEARNR